MSVDVFVRDCIAAVSGHRHGDVGHTQAVALAHDRQFIDDTGA
jgi:hypothetical protein